MYIYVVLILFHIIIYVSSSSDKSEIFLVVSFSEVIAVAHSDGFHSPTAHLLPAVFRRCV
jgi:hypothetical protein